jgi:hypothetical protein
VTLAADWVTISALATAAGTLVLAIATFASVRSANRAARVAEQSLLVGLRPLLMPARPDDPPQKVSFVEGKIVVAPGGAAVGEVDENAVYLAMALRNVGAGIAVLHGWRFYPVRDPSGSGPPGPDEFTRLTRDLYVPSGDVGFWQGSFRDPSSPEFAEAKTVVESRHEWMLDLLYGDHEGGQRVITRFGCLPREDGVWTATAARYWNLDRADPR